jgi:hypothetical protein
MWSSGRGASGDSGKKIRSITPKILALKARFEHRLSSAVSSSLSTVTPTSPEPADRDSVKVLAPQQPHPQPCDGDTTSVVSTAAPSSSTATSMKDSYGSAGCQLRDERISVDGASSLSQPTSPAAARRQTNIIARMASRAELVLKRKSRPASLSTAAAGTTGGESSAVRCWRDKVDTLAAWAARCLEEGHMPELDCEALRTPADVVVPNTTSFDRRGSSAPLPVIHSEETLQVGGLLTPEEDLAECVGSSGSQVHLVGYFALVLNKVSFSL